MATLPLKASRKEQRSVILFLWAVLTVLWIGFCHTGAICFQLSLPVHNEP